MKNAFYIYTVSCGLTLSLLFSPAIKAQTYGWSELGGTARQGFHISGPNGGILSICSDRVGNIYAAGDIIDSGNYVAKYNGTNWSVLGGLSGLRANDQINSVCSDPSGNIYAAGWFSDSTSNQLGYQYVAKYNGIAWSELGGEIGYSSSNPSNIYCVFADADGNIYAAGDFRNSSGKYYVAKYNGTSWSELGGPNALAANDPIGSICGDTLGNIYTAGTFTNSSGRRYVAKYDGITWSELGGLNGLRANAYISSICSDALGNIYAAGGFTNDSGYTYVAKFNGTLWTELGRYNAFTRINSPIASICSDASGNIYAAGEFINSALNEYVAKYNGTAWSELGGLNALAADNFIYSVCYASGNIYAAGSFTDDSENVYVARYGPICQSDTTTLTDTLCQGDSVYIGATGYTLTGTYTDTLTNVGGCDSIVMLNLTVNSIYNDTLIDSICSGDTVYVGTYAHFNTGNYADTLQSFTGCDSIVNLALTIKPAPVVTLSWDSMVILGEFTQNWDTAYCTDAGNPSLAPLVGGTPYGGIYSGVGVFNNTLYFDSIQGFGSPDTVAYTYTDVSGCVGKAMNGVGVNVCEGINSINLNYFISLYPNPADDYTYIDFSPALSGASVCLSDITGRILMNMKLSSTPQPLPTANLVAGIYLVSIDVNNVRSVRLLSKE